MTVIAKTNCRKRRVQRGILESRPPEGEVLEERENLGNAMSVVVTCAALKFYSFWTEEIGGVSQVITSAIA